MQDSKTWSPNQAAALRKHDVKLWFGYSKRILELRGELQPDQLGYIMWGYGHSGAVWGGPQRGGCVEEGLGCRA